MEATVWGLGFTVTMLSVQGSLRVAKLSQFIIFSEGKDG